MSSAYILAERKIIEDASRGIDTTGHIAEQQRYSVEFMGPEEFHFELNKPQTEKEMLYTKGIEIRKQLDEAINNEEYEKANLLQRTLDVIKHKYDKL